METDQHEVMKLECLRLALGTNRCIGKEVELAAKFYEFVRAKPAIQTVDELKAAIRQWVDKVS